MVCDGSFIAVASVFSIIQKGCGDRFMPFPSVDGFMVRSTWVV